MIELVLIYTLFVSCIFFFFSVHFVCSVMFVYNNLYFNVHYLSSVMFDEQTARYTLWTARYTLLKMSMIVITAV